MCAQQSLPPRPVTADICVCQLQAGKLPYVARPMTREVAPIITVQMGGDREVDRWPFCRAHSA